jgi:hypothetical protein
MRDKVITKTMGRPRIGEHRKISFSTSLTPSNLEYLKLIGNGQLNKGIELLIESHKAK